MNTKTQPMITAANVARNAYTAAYNVSNAAIDDAAYVAAAVASTKMDPTTADYNTYELHHVAVRLRALARTLAPDCAPAADILDELAAGLERAVNEPRTGDETSTTQTVEGK